MSSQIDFTYEEISCDRNITNNNFQNGLQTFRFSVSSSNGGIWIPSLSYFMVEYAFGSMNGTSDPYSPVEALKQSDKVTLCNDFVSSCYSGASFRMAGTDINNINGSFAQVSALKNRLKLKSSTIDLLSGDILGWEPSFAKRLSKQCLDGVYNNNGLIDCSPYRSQPLGPYNASSGIPILSCSGAYLPRSNITPPNGVVGYVGAGMQANGPLPTAGNFSWLFSRNNGAGTIAHDAANGTIIQSFNYKLPAGSATSINPIIIDGTLIQVGDRLVLGVASQTESTQGYKTFVNSRFVVGETKVDGDAIVMTVNIENNNLTLETMKAMYQNIDSVITIVDVINSSPYSQADPRSNVVNNMVMWQPPLSIFDQGIENSVFVGDMSLILTPNSNYKTNCVESSKGRYDQDVQHGTDFAFGFKSIRLYIARAKSTMDIPKQVRLTMKDFIVCNKQLSPSLDFTLPPSTQQIVVFIQDAGAGMSKLPLNRFKCRQNSPGGNLNLLDQYGPWAKTYDENLQSIQVTFSNFTKLQTLIQGVAQPGLLNNTMLQRYIMNNHMTGQESETFTDFLSNGPYYYFDFERDAQSLGTYCNVKLNYFGSPPKQGSLTADVTSNVNVYVVAIYNREIQLSYSEFGTIISVQTAMQ